MNKESRSKIIIYCISNLLGILSVLTNTVYIVLSILLLFILINNFLIFLKIQKSYKELIENVEKISIYKKKRLKSYFEYTGETLNNIIQLYDSIIDMRKKILKLTLEIITEYDSFLFRRQKEKVNEIRESSRA